MALSNFWAIAALSSALCLSGCGAGQKTTTQSNPTPAPAPSPSPSPQPSTSPDKFLASLYPFDVPGPTTPEGTVTLNSSSNNGSGTLTLVSALTGTTNGTSALKFCPLNNSACTSLTTITSSYVSNTPQAFQFPSKGVFAGNFWLQTDQNIVILYAGVSQGTGNVLDQPLYPASMITGGVGPTAGTSTGSGRVVGTEQNVTLTLTGAAANHSYNVVSCHVDLLNPPGCDPMNQILMTDASGNGSVVINNTNLPAPPIYGLSDASGIEFITGFQVQ
jgi:hypothetical protein